MVTSYSIPTEYRGVQFRSRLEAKWAAFFDNLGWRWEYEPLDLAGYIPDFVLDFPAGPMLVEVKPAMYLTDMQEAAAKIDRSGYVGEAMVVGGRILDNAWDASPAIGLMREAIPHSFPDGGLEYKPGYVWGKARLFWCLHCSKLSFLHDDASWRCRMTGCYAGRAHIGLLEHHEDVYGRWADACNMTQWKPS